MAARRDPAERAYEKLAAHRYGWLVESMVEEPSFVLRSMFGCLACYLHGRLMLLLADRRRPWCGILVPTEREAQAALQAEFPALVVHPVIGKWLYVPDTADDLENAGARLVELALAGDPRLGVEPRPKRRAGPSMRPLRERR